MTEPPNLPHRVVKDGLRIARLERELAESRKREGAAVAGVGSKNSALVKQETDALSAPVGERLVAIETDLKWIKKIGWGVAAITGILALVHAPELLQVLVGVLSDD